MTVTLGIAALVPALLMVWYVVDRDLYPEPPAVVIGCFVLGAGAVLPAALLVTLVRRPLLAEVPDPLAAAAINSFLMVALVEEAAKFAVLVLFAGRRSAFNEPMDGIVYGGAVGLGFAAGENWFFAMAGGLEIALLRAVTVVPMHASIGIVMGFFYGLARYAPERRWKLMAVALLAAIGLHGAYDFPLIGREFLRGMGRDGDWLPLLAVAALALQVGIAIALNRRVRRTQKAGHHERARRPDFRTLDRGYRGFSRARHLKGPAAVVLGGMLAWLASIALVGLIAALLGPLVGAEPGSPVDRATMLVERWIGFGRGGSGVALLMLLCVIAAGVWLFVRGIRWLNQADRPVLMPGPRSGLAGVGHGEV